MPNSFSIAYAGTPTDAATALREQIRAHTETEEEVSSIMRCIERFGGDASILHYQMTPIPARRMQYGASPTGWTVRAVRPEPEPVALQE